MLRLIGIDFALVVATQKLALPLDGAGNQVPFALLIHGAVVAALLFMGRAQISALRAGLLCLAAASAALVQVGLPSGAYSLPSLVLMLVTSALLIVVVPLSAAGYMRLLRMFVALAVAASGLVYLDWLVQLAGFPMPDLGAVIPPALSYSEYVYIQPLEWDSPWMKPNGLVFLEASHVSQFVAMGLVAELAFFRRWRFALACAGALVLSFGGTGLLLVAVSLPILLRRIPPVVMVGAVVLGAATFFVLDSADMTGALVNRSSEFSRSNSSAYNRFILPAERFAEFWADEPARMWLGTGAGTMPKAVNDLARGIAGLTWPPYTKVAVEYGAITFVLWSAFLLVSLFGGGAPFVICWIAFCQYQFLNGSLNVPVHTIYCWLLCAGYLVEQRSRSVATPSLRLPRPALAGAG